MTVSVEQVARKVTARFGRNTAVVRATKKQFGAKMARFGPRGDRDRSRPVRPIQDRPSGEVDSKARYLRLMGRKWCNIRPVNVGVNTV